MDGRGAFTVKSADTHTGQTSSLGGNVTEKISVKEKVRRMQELIEKSQSPSVVSKLPGMGAQPKMVIKETWPRLSGKYPTNQDSNETEIIGVSVENVKKAFQSSDCGIIPDVNIVPCMPRPVQQCSTTASTALPSSEPRTQLNPPVREELTHSVTNKESLALPNVKDIIKKHEGKCVSEMSTTEISEVSRSNPTEKNAQIKSAVAETEFKSSNGNRGGMINVIDARKVPSTQIPKGEGWGFDSDNESMAYENEITWKNTILVEDELRKVVSDMYQDHTSSSEVSHSEKVTESEEEPCKSRIKQQNGLTLVDARQSVDWEDLNNISKVTEDALQEEIFLPIETLRCSESTSAGALSSLESTGDLTKTKVSGGSNCENESHSHEEELVIRALDLALDGEETCIADLTVKDQWKQWENAIENTSSDRDHPTLDDNGDQQVVNDTVVERKHCDILSQMKDDVEAESEGNLSYGDGMLTAIWMPQSLDPLQNDHTKTSSSTQDALGTSTRIFSLAENNLKSGETLGDYKKEKEGPEYTVGSVKWNSDMVEKFPNRDGNECIQCESRNDGTLPGNFPFKSYQKLENEKNDATILVAEIGHSCEEGTSAAINHKATCTDGITNTIPGSKTQEQQTEKIGEDGDVENVEDDTGSNASGTFLVNPDVETEGFADIASTKFYTCRPAEDGGYDKFGGSLLIRKVSVEEGSSSESRVSEDDEDYSGFDEEEEDLEALHERMGEILTWSDNERMSSGSGEEEDLENYPSMSEEDDGDSEEEGAEKLESDLRMTLTHNVKSKISTMTEKDFSVMMSEYRDALNDVARNTNKVCRTSSTRKDSSPERETSDSGNEDGDDAFETIKTYKKGDERFPNQRNHGTDTTTPQKHTCSSGTSMEETLRPASHKPKASCDASTSMDEAALGAVLASLDSGKPATEDCSTITDTAPSVSSVGMNTTQSGSVGEVETNDQDVGSSGEAEDVFEDTDQEDEDEERGSLAGTPVFLDENNGIIKRLRMISEDIEASDRELVTNVLSPMAVNRKVEKWEKTLEDHVTNTDTLRMLQITETSPQRRLSVTELAESETSAERGETDEAHSLKKELRDTESPITPSLSKSISVQVEGDMVRLREEFLNTVKLKKSYEMSEEDLLLVLSEYRENQKNIIERRLDEKRRADQKLQERLLQRKTKALDAATKVISGGMSLEDSIKKMDEDFYGMLSQKFEQQPLTNHEINTLINSHVSNVENFRSRVKMEVSRRRREAIGQMMVQKKKEDEEKESDEVIARNLVMKQQKEMKHVKKLRSQEKARLNEKLKAKMSAKRSQRESLA